MAGVTSVLTSYPDEFDIVIVSALRRSIVDAAGRKLVLDIVDNAVVVEVGEDCHQTSSVPVVSDTTSVVTLTRQVRDRVVRNCIILVDKHLQSTTNSVPPKM